MVLEEELSFVSSKVIDNGDYSMNIGGGRIVINRGKTSESYVDINIEIVGDTIDEGLVVASNADAGFRACLLVDAVVIITFGQCQEQSQQECHQYQPVWDPDVCSQAANQYPHNEADGDNCHVKYGYLLELQAVGDIHQPVAPYYYI